ncbi:hypothetical protein ACVWZI_000284 [Thermostichus sp. OS-CIW-28]|jgi:hypothetical protein
MEVKIHVRETLATVSLRNLGALVGNLIPRTWQNLPVPWNRSVQYMAVIYLVSRMSICHKPIYLSTHVSNVC